MYDTLSIFAPSVRQEPLCRLLSNVTEKTAWETGEVTYVGYLGNLHVETSDGGTKLRGSIATYDKGNNVQALTFDEVREAFARLEDEIGQSLQEASIYRLDIGATLHLGLPCSEYLSRLGTLTRYIRLEQATSLLYKVGRRQVSFYDKRAEMKRKKKKAELPEDGSLLRCEVRYMQNLRQDFGGKITVARLIDPAFFRESVTRWHSTYSSIQKQQWGTLSVTTVPELRDYLSAWAKQHIGQIPLMKMLQGMKDSGTIPTHQLLRMRNYLEELPNVAESLAYDPIEELNKAIAAEAERLTSF